MEYNSTLEKKMHFEINFCMGTYGACSYSKEAFLYHEYYFLMAIKSVWSNIEEHNI